MEKSEERRVCVTGAGGFLASWLVKVLLSKGYKVHGTVRDPDDEKNAHLMKFENASENLKLFKADILDYESVAAAIEGCVGVFHVASPVPSTRSANPEVEVINPAVNGTLNVLKACSAANVKRVVVVSSNAAVSMVASWPQQKLMDEDCWSDCEYCKTTENWYCLSKTLAEKEALEYGKKHGLDVVTFCPPLILGPLLQSTVNASNLYLINTMNGKRESMENRTIHIVDVRDAVDALILLYESPEASGRYIGASHPIKNRDLVDMLKDMYPNYKYPAKQASNHPLCLCLKSLDIVRLLFYPSICLCFVFYALALCRFTEVDRDFLLTSEKLKKLGWKSRPLKETIVDAVQYYEKAGLLNAQ